MPSTTPLALDNLDRIRRVREAFDAAGFTASEICRRLDSNVYALPRRAAPRLQKQCPADAFGVLARLFVLGFIIPTSELHALLGVPLTDDLLGLGLLTNATPDHLISTFCFSPIEDVLLLQEASWSPTIPGLALQVMAFSPSSRLLLQMAITTPCDKVLEIGCGSGLVSLVQARHAKHVIATDLNPRALNLTRFTALFHGFERLETRAGSLFDPVVGMRFDRIVTNPPYVLTPPKHAAESKHLFRDSGLPADGLSEAIVRGLPKFLEPGGFAQSTINWAHVKGQPWQERIQSWLHDNSCDAWLLRFETQTPEQYATQWIPTMLESEFPRFCQIFEEWLDYFEAERIEAITSGFITLRRRDSGSNWFAEDAAPELLGPCGDSILRGFAARDFLTGLRSENDLLDATFTLAPEARWLTTHRPAEGAWARMGSRLKITKGLAFALDVETMGVQLLSRMDGTSTLRGQLATLANDLKQEVDRVTAAALPLVQTMIEQGFLIPVGTP